MSEPEYKPDSYSLKVTWPEAQPRTSPANQFAITLGVPSTTGPDGIYLSIGHAEPPSPPSIDLEASDLQLTTQIDVLGRYLLTRSRAAELIALLEQAVQALDSASGVSDESSSEQL